MKRTLFAVGAMLLLGISAAMAQEYPKSELFLGYQYVRFSPALTGNPDVNMNGGGGSIGYNFSSMFGLKAEFTGSGIGNNTVCNPTTGACLDRSFNMFTYLFGPQITFRQHSNFHPFAHLMFGGAYSNVYGGLSGLYVTPVNGTTTTSAEGGKNAFALAVGGGIDVKVHKNVALRLGQFDYLMTRFSGREIATAPGGAAVGALEISNQSSFRYMAGINFLIGSSK